jgi:DNA polymerase-3 subunit epsilon
MQTLSQKLRQLRGWQHLTITDAAKKSLWPIMPDQALKKQLSFESGEMLHEQYRLHLIELADAYGVKSMMMERLLDDEYAWRVSARDGNPETLPRMSQYIYRPLPEAAHNLMHHGEFVVLDLETTGKEPHKDTQICEITILSSIGGVLMTSLVNPGIPIPMGAQQIHGITDEMVASAPTFSQIGDEVARLLNGKVAIIFNAGFDAWVLDRLFIENDLDMPNFQQWCLMLAYAEHAKIPGKFGSYAWQSLSAACTQQEIEADGEAHRTLADTTQTWRLLQKLAQQYEPK